MDMQCYQCRTVTADPDLTAMSGVLLCPACKTNPSVAVQVYAMLVSSYAPETLTQVRDTVARLEAERNVMRDALRPFAEACQRLEAVADGETLHMLFPSDFLDSAETCIWEAAKLYERTE